MAQLPPAALIQPNSDQLLEQRNVFEQRVAARANAAGRQITMDDRVAIAREIQDTR